MTEGNWCTSFSGTPLKSYTTEVHPEVCAYTASGGFPDGAVVKNPPAFAEDAEDTSLIPGSGRFPWKRVWQATPVFLPGKFHGQRGQAGYSPQSCKVLDTTEHTHTHTHCSRVSPVRLIPITVIIGLIMHTLLSAFPFLPQFPHPLPVYPTSSKQSLAHESLFCHLLLIESNQDRGYLSWLELDSIQESRIGSRL